MTKPPLCNALIHSACDGTWLLVGPDINARKANIDAHRAIRIIMRSSSLTDRVLSFKFTSHRDWMPVSMNQRGCPSALPFLRCKVYSGQEFFELRGQLVARVGSRVVKRHLCRDQHSIHQPHLILAKGLVLIGGPPQRRYEQSDDRNLDCEDSEFFQGGFSR